MTATPARSRFSHFRHSLAQRLRGGKLWRKGMAVVAPGLLVLVQMAIDRRPALAQTAPGVFIDNTATGSFIDTATDTEKTVVSNTVRVQVIEVAGITATFSSAREATTGEAGANGGSYQGDNAINTGDLAYFDFVVTNTGNDPTQFFIPAAPSSVTGGTFSASIPIQIIAVDPDGSGATAPTPLSVNVTTAGNTTTLLGATNGYIPPKGTVTIRVPVKVTETTIGNAIEVVLGNTPPNNNAANTQNQTLAATTHDLYTVDLADGTTVPTQLGYTGTTAEANGAPNPEKEASALGSANLAAAYQLKGYKSAKLTTDTDGSGSITEGDRVTWTLYYVNTGSGTLTTLQLTDNLEASGTTYVPSSLTLQTGNTTTFPAALASGTPTLNPTYDGNTTSGTNPTDDDIFSGTLPSLAPGEMVRVEFAVTVGDKTPDARTESNQTTATANQNGGAALTPVPTDNVDNSPLETLPTNVTIPPSSITQTETTSLNPTTFDVVAVALVSGDYGDSPTSYGTNTAVHTATGSTLALGSVAPDAETGPAGTLNGTGDDTTDTDDEEAVGSFPILATTGGATYSVLVNASNTSGANAYLAGYIDFNRDGDFEDANERSATVTIPSSTTNPRGFLVTFTTPAGMTTGGTYARFRLSSTQTQVESPTAAATGGEVEDYALAVTADSRDYGDAIDTGSGTASGNYATTASDGGPSHGIVAGLRLGGSIDADDGTLQNNGANGDDANNVDDEDGVSSFSTLEAIASQTYNITTSVTNSTASAAYVVGYIDFNRDGDFADSGEKSATITVAANSGTANQTLSFTTPAGITTGTTYVRIRLASVQGEAEVSTGAATAGEVEDYPLTILPNLVGTGPQFTCDATLHVVTGAANTDSTLHEVNRGSQGSLTSETAFAFADTKTLPTGTQTYSVNALAYNPVDNYLYGVIIDVSNSGGTSNVVKGGIIQIDSTGSVSFLGVPTQASNNNDGQSTPNFVSTISGNTNTGFPAGTFLLDGTYVVSEERNNNSTNSFIFLVDVTQSPPTYDYKGSISGSFFDDFAVNPQDTTTGRVYGVPSNVSTTSANRLVYFNVGSLGGSSAVSTVQNATSGTTGVTVNYGSQFFDSFGRMLFRTGDSPNNLYILNGTTGAATSLLTGPTGGRHDGTSCNSVELEKAVSPTTVAAGNTVTYTYRIANARLTPITLTFEDSLASVNNFPGTARNESTTPVKGTFTGVFPSPPSGGSISLLDSNRTLRIASLTVPAQSIISFSAEVLIDPTSAIDPTGDPDGSTTNSQTPYFNQAELTGLPNPLPSVVYSDDFTTGLAADPTQITITPAVATNPSVLLVKRITAINGTPITTVVDPNSTTDTADNNAGWPANYLQGAVASSASPGDTVDYTIYFLNAGTGAANNVQMCDPLSQYLTYAPNAYDPQSASSDGGATSGLGMALVLTNGATTTTNYLTGLGTDSPDRGEFVAANTVPTGCLMPGTLQPMTAADNTNGTLRVNLTRASGPTSLPAGAYGYLRFRAVVK